MKKSLIILGIAVYSLTSCNQWKKGEGDLQYKIYEDKSGPTIKEGDFVAIKAIEKTEEDSVLFSSYDIDRSSLLLQSKSAFKGDLYAGLGLLSEGDSASFKISIDSMVQKMNRPQPQNTKSKYIIYTIKVDKVIPKGKLDDTAFRAVVSKFINEDSERAKNQEAKKISNYILSKDLKPTLSASGLNYLVTKTSTGPKANVGDTVEVNYTGTFLSGKVFDTSIKDIAVKSGTFMEMRPYQPIKVPAGLNGSIPGFDEALLLFPKGTKATLIIPSKLAYGEQGTEAIPPFTPLIFDIEIVNIIPGQGGAQPNANLPLSSK